MEANTQLLRVLQEMRAEISKLEKENQALRMKLASGRASGSGGESGDEREEEACGPSPAELRADATPARPEHQGNVMIVRRYSISSSVHSFAANDPWKARKRHPNGGIVEAQGPVKSLTSSSVKKQDNEDKMLAADSFSNNSSSQRASPEHVFGCRDKIKTVSFLLPMGVSSYSKNSSSLKCSPDQTSKQLSAIAE
ncbi:putative coiled-coil domain-containing protein 195 [Sciurus carolinensis]|uniref:putative coiled-coil domain-containing protein 195 n=1 Tax=Sciurus carolinensis TaxID=30640 RepID=UPI001FB2897A|nr:putative coiled-coil domain-containing protein 195 [Sciurus carolinensis]